MTSASLVECNRHRTPKRSNFSRALIPLVVKSLSFDTTVKNRQSVSNHSRCSKCNDLPTTVGVVLLKLLQVKLPLKLLRSNCLMVDKSLVWKRRRDSEEMVLKRLKIAEKSNRRSGGRDDWAKRKKLRIRSSKIKVQGAKRQNINRLRAPDRSELILEENMIWKKVSANAQVSSAAGKSERIKTHQYSFYTLNLKEHVMQHGAAQTKPGSPKRGYRNQVPASSSQYQANTIRALDYKQPHSHITGQNRLQTPRAPTRSALGLTSVPCPS
ncbi:hypothetical protein M9H77_07507 [Catharanthus roseus]|uniref:Uncharacterized protein n=1 Tax=Catharanthus roseus TaxID=4058 RepID=A0ACC0BVD3_CATRO|nr:hypothetical protein M9H77_07507 [Catharanthus roseus]